MKHLLLIGFCLLTFSLHAEPIPENSSLSSTNASYDGNSLLLTGHVVLDHGLGMMTAEEASLQRQEAGKDFPFSLIQLRKDVLLALKNSAQVACGSADLDFLSLKGVLLPPENGTVIYTDQIRKKKGAESVALKLSGQRIELQFVKQPSDSKKTEYDIENILAQTDVIVDYASDFQLLADHVLYRKELSSDNKTTKREFQGMLTAYPKEEGAQCRLTHQGDVIDADMVDLNLIHSRLSLLHPKGTLASSFLPHAQKGSLHFRSDHLYWDQPKNTLTLKGHIVIDETVLGNLSAEDELQIVQGQVKDKHTLKAIHSQGPSKLVYKDPHNAVHQLISHGSMHIDRDQLRATVESPEQNGITPHDKQLYYQEEEIAIFADHAALEYSITEETLQPSLLTLKGNIRLFSHDFEKPPRCGIADRLTYSLTTRTLILSANPGKKVLFWDETEGMHLSAPEVHITFDPVTKQQSIKGIGAVQFAFSPEEQSKLQQIFPQLKKLL